MNPKDTCLLLFLRAAIGEGETIHALPPEVSFADLCHFAKKQGVAATIFPILKTMPGLTDADHAYLTQWELSRLQTRAIRAHYTETIESALQAAHIPHLHFKGEQLAAYYPMPSMRESTDMDVLYNSDFSLLQREMERVGVQKVERGRTHSLFWFDRFLVEFHTALFEESSPFFSYFCDVFSRAEAQNESCYTMCKTDVYIYHLAHMVKHILNGGIGIRALCDLYLLDKKERFSTQQAVQETLTVLGLATFAAQMQTLADKVFGVGVESLSDREEMWLSFFLSGDAFGSAKRFAMLSVRGASRGKFRYLLRRLFPCYKDMTWLFPVLEKMPLLLPIFYPYRWLRALFQYRKRVKPELQKIENNNAEALEELLSSYENMGIPRDWSNA